MVLDGMVLKKKQILATYAQRITRERRKKLEKNAQERTRYITVVLEDVYQPHNISAVLRTCDCFGIQDVHIIEKRHTFHVQKDVVKGADQWLSLNYYRANQDGGTAHCFSDLREKGYTIVATTPHEQDMFIDELPLSEKVALVFGTEQQGLSSFALKQADAYVKIPLYGFTESFNISVCAGIALYELTQRLRRSTYQWRLTESEVIDLQLEWLSKTTSFGDSIKQQLLAL